MKRNDKQSKKSKNITSKSNKNVDAKASNNKNVGFVAEDHSFELDRDNGHSFEVRDCK